MDVTVWPSELAGSVAAVPSKSMAHRLLVCAALAKGPTSVACADTSDDIDATARCLRALGAGVTRTDGGFVVTPVGEPAETPTLDCGESGSTLRFLLPVVAALGHGGAFVGAGRLLSRPLAPLLSQLRAHGVRASDPARPPLVVSGRLQSAVFELPGDVSSQFVSGLLMAAPAVDGPLAVRVTEPVGSRPYIDLTCDALAGFGARVVVLRGEQSTTYGVPAEARLVSPGSLSVEGDWSAAAFWLAAGALSEDGVAVRGLNLASHQGDRAVLGALAMLGAHVSRTDTMVGASRSPLVAHPLNVDGCPDLVPPLAAVAARAKGTTRIRGARRLRLKESDRLESVAAALAALGGSVDVVDDGLDVHGVATLTGGVVDAAGDHRIAMMAAVAACGAEGPSVIRGAECVAKSYPRFFDDLASLGARVERGAA